jgi:hypothetical protein
MAGGARDIAGDRILATASFDAQIDAERQIVAIGPDPRLAPLIGQRAGGRLRAAVAAALPEEMAGGTPYYLLLDDISGANLVSNWAWSLWDADWTARLERMKSDPDFGTKFARENICTGLRTGSSGLSLTAGSVDAGELRNADDPDGWHEFPHLAECAFRRARRIDVWRDGVLHIDAHFQDSASTPEGGRAAVHEYRLRASADPETLELLSLDPEPRVLPFAECPVAGDNARRLIGSKLPELRDLVLAHLKGPVGCTHLNDALRALADVPVLAREIA